MITLLKLVSTWFKWKKKILNQASEEDRTRFQGRIKSERPLQQKSSVQTHQVQGEFSWCPHKTFGWQRLPCLSQTMSVQEPKVGNLYINKIIYLYNVLMNETMGLDVMCVHIWINWTNTQECIVYIEHWLMNEYVWRKREKKFWREKKMFGWRTLFWNETNSEDQGSVRSKHQSDIYIYPQRPVDDDVSNWIQSFLVLVGVFWPLE